MRPIPHAAVPFALALALAACKPVSFTAPHDAADRSAAATTGTATATPGTALPDDNLNAVVWVQASAEYRALTRGVYRAAADHLDAALAEPNWDALVPGERANAPGDLPPAVILDVDETVLDNSPYQARLVLDGSE